MKIRTLLATTLTAAALLGCAAPQKADPAGPGRDFDDSYVPQIQKNVTSKDDIRAHFGEPMSIATTQATELWTYRYETTSASGDAKKKKNLTIEFTADKVQDVKYTK